ncbi:MAG: acetylornithine/N-succinyldiaminopimelate aminotransferase [Gammaproteobacteria bacterium]|jgi:acetylornithine/N-succinyldiaminopimelate aminotransferase
MTVAQAVDDVGKISTSKSNGLGSPKALFDDANEPAFDHALMTITTRPENVMVRGVGSYLWDSEGKRYLDFIQGWAVNVLGHCPSEIVNALRLQSSVLISPSPALHNAPHLALSKMLTDLAGMHQVHFANSGAEANEAAVKLARKWGQIHKPGAFEIISTHGGFHGRTLAMMSASGKAGWDTMYSPMPTGFRKVPFDDIEAMRTAISAQTVALMVEPIQGEAGVVVPAVSYLRELRQLADDANILLILDEVQTGVGRTGTLFAFEQAGIAPDILTLAKGLGGGVPISAVLATEPACCFSPGDQGGTYNGSPLMTAVAQAVVDTVRAPAFLANVKARGKQLADGLAALGERHGIVETRGAGLLWAAGLAHSRAADVAQAAMDGGLLVNAPRADTLRFMPSLRVSESEIEEALMLLAQALNTA